MLLICVLGRDCADKRGEGRRICSINILEKYTGF